jgi:5-methylcytosine-specific restriction endonuclease McrA
VGARAEREASAARKFRRDVLKRARGRCERCGLRPGDGLGGALEAHHIVPRSLAAGWEHKHDATVNGAALCGGDAGCHARVHRHEAHDWARWLKPAPRTHVAR